MKTALSLNMSKTLLLVAGFCIAATPALAGNMAAPDAGGPLMLSDTQMDAVVAGQVLETSLYISANQKKIDMTGKGPASLLTGTGPDNNGAVQVHIDGSTVNPSIPPGLVTIDGTHLGGPPGPDAKGVLFLTVTLNN